MDFYVIVWLEVFNKWNIYDKKSFGQPGNILLFKIV